MNTVTLLLPKDLSLLKEKYSKALASIVSEILTQDEMNYLITEFEKDKIAENRKA